MKIFCIGHNYRAHIEEMGQEPPAEPLFFMKPETALIRKGFPFFYPDFSREVHYEAELVLRICRVGKNIQPKFASRYYKEIGVGIDFTARDLQRRCMQQGLPWEVAKSFDGSGPVSDFVPLDTLKDPKNIRFSLKMNEVTMQEGNSGDLVFSFDQIVSHVSHYCMLKTGDLIFTGTPSGVGPVAIGDRLELFLEEQKMMQIDIK
ncbi:MAG: fumarylacetoacetate hydrolase family protein [Bacteroidales bacterium]